jgi:hypothetical protein
MDTGDDDPRGQKRSCSAAELLCCNDTVKRSATEPDCNEAVRRIEAEERYLRIPDSPRKKGRLGYDGCWSQDDSECERYHDDKREVALFKAIYAGDTEQVAALLAERPAVDVNITDVDGWSPIHLATKCERLVEMELLISAGADVNLTPVVDGRPLLIAIFAQSPECTELLIAAGADVNYYDTCGWAVLHYTCARENVDCVRIMVLNGGANVNVETDESMVTPIEVACGQRRFGAACALLDASDEVDINRIIQFGEFPPIYTAIAHNAVELLRRLLLYGADTKMKLVTSFPDDPWETPLEYAHRLGPLRADCYRLLSDPEMQHYTESMRIAKQTAVLDWPSRERYAALTKDATLFLGVLPSDVRHCVLSVLFARDIGFVANRYR